MFRVPEAEVRVREVELSISGFLRLNSPFSSEELKKAVAVSEEKNPAAFPKARPIFQQLFPCRKVPKPWQGEHFVLPENRGRIFQQRRNLPETLSSKEFRTTTAFSQDTFDHDKEQKSAISGRRLHWRLSTGFFAFSPGSLCNLVRRAPQNLEKVAKTPVEKIASNPVTSVAVMVFSAPILEFSDVIELQGSTVKGSRSRTARHCIVRCGCGSDADSNRAMPTARETSKTQRLRNAGPFFFPHFSLLVIRNWS